MNWQQFFTSWQFVIGLAIFLGCWALSHGLGEMIRFPGRPKRRNTIYKTGQDLSSWATFQIYQLPTSKNELVVPYYKDTNTILVELVSDEEGHHQLIVVTGSKFRERL